MVMSNIFIDISLGVFLVILILVTIVVIKNITKGFSHHHHWYWYVDGIQVPTNPHNYSDYYQNYYKKRVQSYSDTKSTDSKRS